MQEQQQQQQQPPPASSPLQQQQSLQVPSQPHHQQQQQSPKNISKTSPFLSPAPADGYKIDAQQAHPDPSVGKDLFSITTTTGASSVSPRTDCLSPKELVIPTFVTAHAQDPPKPGSTTHKSTTGAPFSLSKKVNPGPKTRRNTLYADGKTDRDTMSKKVMTTLGNGARAIRSHLQSPGYQKGINNDYDDYDDDDDDFEEDIYVSQSRNTMSDEMITPRPPPLTMHSQQSQPLNYKPKYQLSQHKQQKSQPPTMKYQQQQHQQQKIQYTSMTSQNQPQPQQHSQYQHKIQVQFKTPQIKQALLASPQQKLPQSQIKQQYQKPLPPLPPLPSQNKQQQQHQQNRNQLQSPSPLQYNSFSSPRSNQLQSPPPPPPQQNSFSSPRSNQLQSPPPPSQQNSFPSPRSNQLQSPPPPQQNSLSSPRSNQLQSPQTQQVRTEKKAPLKEETNIESSAAADEFYGPGGDEIYSTGSDYNEKSTLKSSIHQSELEQNEGHGFQLHPAFSTKMAADNRPLHKVRSRGKAVSMSMMSFSKSKKPQSLGIEGLDGGDVYVDEDPMNNAPGGSWNDYSLSRKFSYGNVMERYSYIPDDTSDGGSSSTSNGRCNGIRIDNNSSGSGVNGGAGGSMSGSSSFRSAMHDLLNFESYVSEDVEKKTTKILKNRYILGNLLGRGSFAKVKEAYDLKLHKIVAIKKFNHESLDSIPNGIASMEGEFSVYRSLPPHKNVVSMIDSWDDDVKGHSYLVIDYMPSGTLDGLIRKAWSGGIKTSQSPPPLHRQSSPQPPQASSSSSSAQPQPSSSPTTSSTTKRTSIITSTTSSNSVYELGLPLPEMRLLFRSALNGLNHLHKNGVYHRDIKPDNLMLMPDLTIRLSDFGTATFEKSTKGIGAPGFQPPEVILTGSSPDAAKIDTWAMGVTLHMMVTGMHPFGTQTSTLYQIIERIGNSQYVPPENIPEQLKDLLRRILTPIPQERPTVDEILEHPWMTQNYDVSDDVDDDVIDDNENVGDGDDDDKREFVLPDLLPTVFTNANIDRLQEEFKFDEQQDVNVHTEEVLDVEIDGDSIRVKKKRRKSGFLCCGSCCIIS